VHLLKALVCAALRQCTLEQAKGNQGCTLEQAKGNQGCALQEDQDAPPPSPHRYLHAMDSMHAFLPFFSPSTRTIDTITNTQTRSPLKYGLISEMVVMASNR
jgi:hypothetical protein